MPRTTCWASAVRPAPPGSRIGSPSCTADRLVGERQRLGLAQATLDRRHVAQHLPGDQPIAGADRVADTDLDRVEPARLGQQVELRLVGEAGLHDTEPAHRPARQVVGADRPPLDDRVRAAVRPLGVRDRVEQHRRRGRRVGAAVEHEAGLDLDDLAVGRGVVAHPDRRRMAVDVTEEALRPRVVHAHRSPEPQRQQAGVDLERDVLAGAERPADAGQHEPHLLLGQTEAGRDLLAVLVQPLGGDVQLDAVAAVVGDRQRRLEPEERLVLHADLVGALDDDVAGDRRVAAEDPLLAQHVAVRVDRLGACRRSPPRDRARASSTS